LTSRRPEPLEHFTRRRLRSGGQLSRQRTSRWNEAPTASFPVLWPREIECVLRFVALISMLRPESVLEALQTRFARSEVFRLPKPDMCPTRLATNDPVPEEQASLPWSSLPSSRGSGRSRSTYPASLPGYAGGQVINSGEERPPGRWCQHRRGWGPCRQPRPESRSG
jgi:hypothetical protein